MVQEKYKCTSASKWLCRLPVIAGGCPHANACLDCTHFCTSKQFLPQHEEQLERTEELLAIARINNGKDK